jgi:hypothetical protein
MELAGSREGVKTEYLGKVGECSSLGMPERWSRNRSSKRKHHPHRHRCRLRNKMATKSRCNAVVLRGVGKTTGAVPATVALSFASHPSPPTAPITTFSARHTISRNLQPIHISPNSASRSKCEQFFLLSSFFKFSGGGRRYRNLEVCLSQ